MSVPGGFFEVTGAKHELDKIMLGIEANSGRLTPDSSFSLDLWLEMKEEWFRLQEGRDEREREARDEVRDAVAKAMCAIEMRSKAASLEEVQAGIQRWVRHRHEAERLIEELSDYGVEVRKHPEPEPHRLSDAELIDLWWKTCSDEWAIPENLMVEFGRAVLRAAGHRKHLEPVEELTERRITYGYGVNSNQRYSSFYSSFEQMKEHVEQATQGSVDVTKREQRTVSYGPWEPVA